MLLLAVRVERGWRCGGDPVRILPMSRRVMSRGIVLRMHGRTRGRHGRRSIGGLLLNPTRLRPNTRIHALIALLWIGNGLVKKGRIMLMLRRSRWVL